MRLLGRSPMPGFSAKSILLQGDNIVDDQENTNGPSMPVQGQAVKKVYEKPRIVYRAPLEVMAAACTDAGAKAVAGPCQPLLLTS